jgi:YidC/Oxa1 family membrane protein insertase
MNTDKNTVIGFVLLAGLFFTYFWYTNKQQTEMQNYKKHFEDSVAMVKSNAEKAAAIKNPKVVDTTTGDSVLCNLGSNNNLFNSNTVIHTIGSFNYNNSKVFFKKNEFQQKPSSTQGFC